MSYSRPIRRARTRRSALVLADAPCSINRVKEIGLISHGELPGDVLLDQEKLFGDSWLR
jgi:hypothetical protein